MSNQEECVSSLMPPEKDRKPGIDYNAITVKVKIAAAVVAHHQDQIMMKVCLYLHDKRLADAPATLVASKTIQNLSKNNNTDGEDNNDTIIFQPDLISARQIGKSVSEMVEPSMYVSLDVSAGTVTYDDGCGPIFDVKLGDNVELKVKARKKI